MDEEIKRSFEEVDGSLWCSICGSRHYSKWQMSSHYNKEHPAFTFTCSTCYNCFETEDLLKTHTTQRHFGSIAFEALYHAYGPEGPYAVCPIHPDMLVKLEALGFVCPDGYRARNDEVYAEIATRKAEADAMAKLEATVKATADEIDAKTAADNDAAAAAAAVATTNPPTDQRMGVVGVGGVVVGGGVTGGGGVVVGGGVTGGGGVVVGGGVTGGGGVVDENVRDSSAGNTNLFRGMANFFKCW